MSWSKIPYKRPPHEAIKAIMQRESDAVPPVKASSADDSRRTFTLQYTLHIVAGRSFYKVWCSDTPQLPINLDSRNMDKVIATCLFLGIDLQEQGQ